MPVPPSARALPIARRSALARALVTDRVLAADAAADETSRNSGAADRPPRAGMAGSNAPGRRRSRVRRSPRPRARAKPRLSRNSRRPARTGPLRANAAARPRAAAVVRAGSVPVAADAAAHRTVMPLPARAPEGPAKARVTVPRRRTSRHGPDRHAPRIRAGASPPRRAAARVGVKSPRRPPPCPRPWRPPFKIPPRSRPSRRHRPVPSWSRSGRTSGPARSTRRSPRSGIMSVRCRPRRRTRRPHPPSPALRRMSRGGSTTRNSHNKKGTDFNPSPHGSSEGGRT